MKRKLIIYHIESEEWVEFSSYEGTRLEIIQECKRLIGLWHTTGSSSDWKLAIRIDFEIDSFADVERYTNHKYRQLTET